jgi:acyl carrier protein
MDDLEEELKRLIVDCLKLEGIQPSDIDSTEQLMGVGLGLDSIDGLEIGVAVRKKYGVSFGKITEEVKAHFRTIRDLAQYIRLHREG